MYKSKMMIVVRRDLGMRKGKIAAQAGHACVEAVLRALAKEERLGDIELNGGQISLKPSGKPDTPLSDWFRDGEAKICVYVNSLEELLGVHERLTEAGIISALIEDAGCTEFHGVPTYTCLACEPSLPERIDPITGGLPLF